MDRIKPIRTGHCDNRRKWNVSWTQLWTNTEVLSRMKNDKEIIDTLKKRKMTYFEHILRNSRLIGKYDRYLGISVNFISKSEL